MLPRSRLRGMKRMTDVSTSVLCLCSAIIRGNLLGICRVCLTLTPFMLHRYLTFAEFARYPCSDVTRFLLLNFSVIYLYIIKFARNRYVASQLRSPPKGSGMRGQIIKGNPIGYTTRPKRCFISLKHLT